MISFLFKRDLLSSGLTKTSYVFLTLYWEDSVSEICIILVIAVKLHCNVYGSFFQLFLEQDLKAHNVMYVLSFVMSGAIGTEAVAGYGSQTTQQEM